MLQTCLIYLYLGFTLSVKNASYSGMTAGVQISTYYLQDVSVYFSTYWAKCGSMSVQCDVTFDTIHQTQPVNALMRRNILWCWNIVDQMQTKQVTCIPTSFITGLSQPWQNRYYFTFLYLVSNLSDSVCLNLSSCHCLLYRVLSVEAYTNHV